MISLLVMTAVNLAALGAGLTATISALSKRMGRLERKYDNGITEQIATLKTDVALLQQRLDSVWAMCPAAPGNEKKRDRLNALLGE